MGYFRRTPEENYMAALATAIDSEARVLGMRAVNSSDPCGEIAESLARVVSLRMIGEQIRLYADSRVVNKWIRVIDKGAIQEARRASWTVGEMRGLDMQEVWAVAQMQADRYASLAGSDNFLPFEMGNTSMREVRTRAIRAVHPDWDTAAVNSLFRRIIGGDPGYQ